MIDNEQFDGDIVKEVQDSLCRQIASNKAKIFKIRSQIKRLNNQKGRIAKEGENLFEIILNNNIIHLGEQIIEQEKAIEKYTGFIKRLDDYCDVAYLRSQEKLIEARARNIRVLHGGAIY